ncbi:MAG TPA: hypothetical protein DIT89_03450 [Planctomycetaceae bacterium]|nr:hypothetical protein [Planctomycetaceae bacterium]
MVPVDWARLATLGRLTEIPKTGFSPRISAVLRISSSDRQTISSNDRSTSAVSDAEGPVRVPSALQSATTISHLSAS